MKKQKCIHTMCAQNFLFLVLVGFLSLSLSLATICEKLRVSFGALVFSQQARFQLDDGEIEHEKQGTTLSTKSIL
jgi:hypothetical protein